MRAVFIQNSGTEMVSDDTACISCSPLGAFSLVVSDTHMIVQVPGHRWRVPIADVVMFTQLHGDEIPCDYPST